MRAHLTRQIFARPSHISALSRLKLLYLCRTITSLSSSPIDPAIMPINTTNRLEKLRALMKANGADIYVIPSGDSHNSEYISACDARREYISGFTGSSGVAVVASNAATLSTDGRYFNQASQELDSNWTLLKQGLKDVPTWQEWAAQESKDGRVVAIDASLVTGPEVEILENNIKASGSGKLIALDDNLVDLAWSSDRPARAQAPVFVHPLQYAGQTVQSKLAALRENLKRTSSLGLFVTMLDEIAYLFNLRGSDIQYNPVFFSYAIITATSATLYVEKSRFEPNVMAHLEESGVEVKPYDSFFADTRAMYQEAKSSPSPASGRFQVMNTGSWALKRALGDGDLIEEIKSPIALAKSVKNEVELNGMRNCQMRDGAAIIEYLAWLEDQLIKHKATISEAEGADKLEEFRSKKQWFKGQSFDTISSTGSNAAIMHYKPEHGSDSTIDPSAIYLLDSGAQYLDGTTDTTRTIHIGNPTEMEIEAYTRALKANIAMDRAIFPQGVSGFAIDCIARQHLWNAGWDFRHGTGHGVGSFLNVHEGPIGIGIRPHYAESPLVAGNVLSNEPGFYADGSFGVRIENMIIVKEVKTKYCFGDRAYLGFENITVVPYCRKLMNMELLTSEEKDWLNKNNALILERTKPFVSNDPVTSAWLVRETQPY